MFPYWVLFTVCAVGAVQYRPDWRTPIQGGPLFIALGMLILLMIGLRFEVGGDWINYLGIFDEIRWRDFEEVLGMGDPGYSLFNWIALRLGLGIWFVNMLCGVIFTWGLVRFTRRQPNPWLAVLIAVPYLIIVVAMGYTRQAVAIGLILAGMSEFDKRQSMVRFGCYILAAALFHKTAIVILPLVSFAATKNRWVMIGLGAVLAASLYYMFLNARIDTLMLNYVEEEYDSQGAWIRVSMNLVPAAVFLLFRDRFGFDEFHSKLWRNFSYAAFGALALLLLLRSSTVVDRLALYLIPLQLVIFARMPFAFATPGRQNGQLTLLLIGYSALVQFVFLTVAAHAHYWLPYRTVLF